MVSEHTSSEIFSKVPGTEAFYFTHLLIEGIKCTSVVVRPFIRYFMLLPVTINMSSWWQIISSVLILVVFVGK